MYASTVNSILEIMPQTGVGRLLLDSLGVERFKPEGLFFVVGRW